MAEQGLYPLRQVEIRLKVSEGSPLYGSEPMDSPERAAEVMAKMLAGMDREYFCVVNLDTKLRPLSFNVVSIGGLDTCQVPVQNVFKAAIMTNAARTMLFHCHPSGDVRPSREDVETTKLLAEAGHLLGIPVVDHIIVGGGSGERYSMHENMPELLRTDERGSVLGELKRQKYKRNDRHGGLREDPSL